MAIATRTNELYSKWGTMTDARMANAALELAEQLELELEELKEERNNETA